MTLILAFVASAVRGESETVTWRDEGWAVAGTTFEAVAELDTSIQNASCQYMLPDGARGEVPCFQDSDRPDRFRASIPVGASVGTMALTLTYRIKNSVAVMSDPRSIAVGESVELDITGVAAEELRFPLKGWGVEVLYVPCCNISDGILQIVRFPTSPVPGGKQAPGTLLSSFVLARPDELVRATAGLTIRLSYDPERLSDASSDLLTVFRWDDKDWEPVMAPSINPGSHTVTFACPNGGIFVLAEAEPASSTDGH